MRKVSALVIGGGASGIVAAISAKRAGSSVMVCEKMPRLGKKILASGNGRCNLSNESLDESAYNPASRPLVREVLQKFSKCDIIKFFNNLGLLVYSDEGRIFPVTNQSSSVLKVLEMELDRLKIPLQSNFEVSSVTHSGQDFIVRSASGEKMFCDNVILASGANSYPALGSDGSGYPIAKHFGHSIVAPVPVCVPVVVKDPFCHLLQGQKISAGAKVVIGSTVAAAATGDLLFTKYGLSGTAILDISEEVSISLNRRGMKQVNIDVDMAPFMSDEELRKEIERRVRGNFSIEEMLAGILPNKFSAAFAGVLKTRRADLITNSIKSKIFNVTGTRGWNEAEFTAGGIDTGEVLPTLESKFREGLYFAGEVLDVDGKRGGYNLAWAWASGFVSGLTG